MPTSYPFTAGLRVLCERGLVEHRFVAGAADEVADSDVVSVLAVHPGGRRRAVSSAGDDPWRTEIGQFLDCVRDGTPPADGTLDQARAALAVALAARRSLESGLPEPV